MELIESDISNIWYLCDIPLTTVQIEKFFKCKPTESREPHSRYNWIFNYYGNVYCIYDWSYMDDTFDEYIVTEWYLAGKSMENVNEIIKTMINKKRVPKILPIIEW